MLGVPAKNSTRPTKYSRTQKEREKQKNVVCVFMPACVCLCAFPKPNTHNISV